MDTKVLIETIKLYPTLYDRKHSSINIEHKNLIWNEISQKIDQPVEKCKAKWRNLRDSYQKAMKWKHELEAIGKLSSYHPYKHEYLLEFLEVRPKRKISDGSRRSKFKVSNYMLKKQKLEDYNTSQDAHGLSSHAVEFLVENEKQNIQNDDSNADIVEAVDEQDQYEEITEEEQIYQETSEHQEESVDSNNKVEEKPFLLSYDCAHETALQSSEETREEITYQETYPNESETSYTLELDSWLSGIKTTLMILPKLLQARAKKQINDLVSDFEINYLESLDQR